MRETELMEELRNRLARYPPERYPIQHATAKFHLGVLMTNAGQLDEGAASLETALELFDPQKLPVEHAKSLNALGAVRRLQGRLDDAAEAFEDSAKYFEGANLPLEQGAAMFNLGLVRRDLGDEEASVRSLRQALTLLDPNRVAAQAGAAHRELGATLLAAGELEDAIDSFRSAQQLAEQAQDWASLGAAANGSGLAELASGHPESAIEHFEASVAANPRGVRPEAYAMGKANLALAYLGAGRQARARLAARQALHVSAPDPVRSQAESILERLGDPAGDLLEVLDEAEPERWPGIVREEVVWWGENDTDRVRSEAEAWIKGLVSRRDRAPDMAEHWLGALLELTPEQMERVVTTTMDALSGEDQAIREKFRSILTAAMPRFHSPQFLRMKDAFATTASRLGVEGWS